MSSATEKVFFNGYYMSPVNPEPARAELDVGDYHYVAERDESGHVSCTRHPIGTSLDCTEGTDERTLHSHDIPECVWRALDALPIDKRTA